MHAVVFDIDGTLLRSASVDDDLYKDAVSCVLGDVQIRPSLTDYDYVSDSGILSQILADNSISDDPKLVWAIKSHFVESLRSHISANGPFPEIPGARNILRMLDRSSNHSVAIATGGWHASALLKLETAGLSEFDFPIATSDDAFDRVEIMRIALSRLGSTFESITYYGDGPWDRDASYELGWNFIAVGPALDGLDSYAVLDDI
ncbi:MAG: HAD family hydrolase [Gammaproteobacteria bacterium]|nr:HAD family hydrolase [Gammaproteobacteria bacterium]MDH3749555.1 HAD family hydrolase [Gammaproteobacteria bacterium]MDH3806975.1 HAD family hydrolase [Gammaproteobacteria bacterium]